MNYNIIIFVAISACALGLLTLWCVLRRIEARNEQRLRNSEQQSQVLQQLDAILSNPALTDEQIDAQGQALTERLTRLNSTNNKR